MASWGKPTFPKNMRSTEIDTPEDSIRLPALVCLCGKRGSGKTATLYFLLKQLKHDKLADRIWIISPTAFSPANEAMFKDLGIDYEKDLYEDMSVDSLRKVDAALAEEGAQWKKDQEDREKYQRLVRLLKGRTPIDKIDAELLTTAEAEGWWDEPPKSRYPGGRPKLHLIIDDAQGTPLLVPSSKSCLGELSMRHRHAHGPGLSLYLCLQNYSAQGGVPKYIRTNCTALVLFKIYDQKAIGQIVDEVAGDVPKEDFLRLYDQATSEPYRPLVVEFQPKKHIFRAGWNLFMPCTSDPTPKGR